MSKRMSKRFENIVKMIERFHKDCPTAMPNLWSNVFIPCLTGFIEEMKTYDNLSQRLSALTTADDEDTASNHDHNHNHDVVDFNGETIIC